MFEACHYKSFFISDICLSFCGYEIPNLSFHLTTPNDKLLNFKPGFLEALFKGSTETKTSSLAFSFVFFFSFSTSPYRNFFFQVSRNPCFYLVIFFSYLKNNFLDKLNEEVWNEGTLLISSSIHSDTKKEERKNTLYFKLSFGCFH